jgi:hypothetical protein
MYADGVAVARVSRPAVLLAASLAAAAGCGGIVVFDEDDHGGAGGAGSGASAAASSLTSGPAGSAGDTSVASSGAATSTSASTSVAASSGTGGPNGICETGVFTGSEELDLCLEAACCAELVACAVDGPDACTECFADGGPLCDDALACIDASSCFPGDCYPDEFLCGSGECISGLFVCDGDGHCLDGSD